MAFIAGDDKDLLAKLRRDIASHTLLIHGKLGAIRFDSISILALLDFACPIRTIIYSTAQEIFAPMSNFLLFYELEEKDNKPIINPIVLIILVISKEHIDKIVVNPSSGM